MLTVEFRRTLSDDEEERFLDDLRQYGYPRLVSKFYELRREPGETHRSETWTYRIRYSAEPDHWDATHIEAAVQMAGGQKHTITQAVAAWEDGWF